jgi:hypothetical protein
LWVFFLPRLALDLHLPTFASCIVRSTGTLHLALLIGWEDVLLIFCLGWCRATISIFWSSWDYRYAPPYLLPSPFCFSSFWDRVSCLCPCWPGLRSSYLCFLL